MAHAAFYMQPGSMALSSKARLSSRAPACKKDFLLVGHTVPDISRHCLLTGALSKAAPATRSATHRRQSAWTAGLQEDWLNHGLSKPDTVRITKGAPAHPWNIGREGSCAGCRHRGRSDAGMRTRAASEAAPIGGAQPDEAALKLQEGKRLMGIALPIFGTGMVQLLLVLLSTIFVGRLGEFQLAVAQLGISLGNASGHYVLSGLALGLETLCGQSYGGNELMDVGRTVQCALVVQTVVAALISCLWLNSEPFLLALNQEPPIAAAAGKYLRMLIPGLLANAWLQPLVKYLQTLERTRPFAVCSAVTLALHLPLNWLLIYKLGYGLDGAALATSIAYGVNLVLLAGYTFFSGVYKTSWPAWSWSSLKKTGTFLKLAFPSMIMLCLEFLTYDVLIIWCGWLPNPTRVVAAFSVAFNTAWLFATLYIALGSALSTRVATELGARDVEGARRVTRVGIPLAAAFGVGSNLLLLAVHRVWPRIFIDRSDAALFKLTSQLLVMYAFICIEDCFSNNLGGIVRGLGRQGIGAAITFSSYYVVALPLAWYFCFKRGMGVFGLLFGVAIGLFFQVGALALVVLRTNWAQMAEEASAANGELPDAKLSTA